MANDELQVTVHAGWITMMRKNGLKFLLTVNVCIIINHNLLDVIYYFVV